MIEGQQFQDIKFQDTLPHHPVTVWRVLTTANLIERWLMPNDFALVVGHKFHFRRAPMGDWNGVVDCEVLEVEIARRLAYSWKGGFGNIADLDTVVTWTLTPVDSGTRLTMVHSGFRLPLNATAFEAMSPGWGRIKHRIAEIVAEETERASINAIR